MHTRRFAILVMVLSLFFAVDTCAKEENLTNSEIRQRIIQRSIDAYSGNCPCPYNLTRNGKRCGKRSAWSKPGGYAPLCYPSDVTDAAVKSFRHKTRQ